MSNRNLDIIRLKLERLDEYAGYLKDLSSFQEATFLSDYRICGAAERYLQLAIEVLLDVGKLVCIHLDLEKPENNHETFEILHKNRIISASLF